jgi:hypothetical protein
MVSMFPANYLPDVIKRFRELEKLASGAIAQIAPEKLFVSLGSETNSIAHLMKHLAGNLVSRWTDFLTTDGEKPDRERDSEFEVYDDDSFAQLQHRFANGWQVLYATLDSLSTDDLVRTVVIRTEPMLAFEAINRQLTHYGYHVGQIVLLARYHSGDAWKSLSIPKGQSKQFNARKAEPRGPSA